jgi:multidrug efflux pump subunit AcrA (membrane-fusion protein)
MRRKLAVILVAILILAAFIGISSLLVQEEDKTQDQLPESSPFVMTKVVSLGTESADILTYGRVVPNKKLMLFSEVPGKLETVGKAFKVGVFFNAGEPILRIDSRELEYQLKTQRAEMLSLLTGLMADIKLDYSEDYSAYSNYIQNFDINGNLKSLPEPSNEQLKMFLSGRGVYRLFYSIKNSEERLDKYVITSPYSGTITMAEAEPGMIVAPGQKLGELSSTGSYEVEIGISDADMPFVSVGTQVSFEDEQTGQNWQGRITRLSGNVDQMTQTVTAFVSISGSDIKEGMYLTATIDGQDIPAVEKIDRNAIVDNRSLFVIEDGTLQKKEVEIVYKGVDFAYVRGVDNGDTIITLPPSNIPLGNKVEPMPAGTVYDEAIDETVQEDILIEEGLE